MKKVLQALQAALKKSYPRRLAGFAKPATDLAKLEKAFGAPLPEDLVALYAWHGGAPGLLVDAETDDSSEGWDLGTPDQVIADWKLWSKLSPKGWHETWLPIFSNGAGDNVCLDAASGKLVGMFHEEPDDHPVVFRSLEKAMIYVLERVKKGTWCGVPETKELSRVIGKIERGGDMQTVFGNDVFRLMERDPRAAIAAIAVAEKKKVAPSIVLKYRAEAQLGAGDVDDAYASYKAYVQDAIKTQSVYNPPFRTMRDGFTKAKKPQWAFEAGEALEMHSAMLLDAWLSGKEKSRMKDMIELADSSIEGTDPEDEVRGWMKHGLSEEDARKRVDALVASGRLSAASGAPLARACAAKAKALTVLGKAAEAKKLWADAAKADANVAEFWRAFG